MASLRFLPMLVLGSVSGAAVFLMLHGAFGDDPALTERIASLEQQLSAKDLQISFLRERRRVARLTVLDQVEDATRPGGKQTRVLFQELDSQGQPYNEGQSFTFDGDLLYIDALVIQFDDQFVAANDLLRGSSLLLFRRLFGEYQNPADGFVLDPVGQTPVPYAADGTVSAFHRDLWQHFWDYAQNPAVVREAGVRAMHGEAPFLKLAAGQVYEMELRTSGGLSLRPVTP